MAGKHEWDSEHKARAIELGKEGRSGTEVANILAREFGIAKTRNACIGLLHRAGVSAGGGVWGQVRKAMTATHIKRRYHRQKLAQDAFNHVRPADSPIRAILRDGLPLPPASVTDIARVSFDDMEEHQCRWIPADIDPKGHPQNKPLYCGEKTAAGTDYCADHVKRKFSAPSVRHPPTTPAREWIREKGGGYTDTNRSRTLMKVN